MPAAPELLSDHVFVALDFASEAPARALVGVLGGEASAYKFGIQWLVACGPGLPRELAMAGKQVFLDLKLFEIPHSVAGAVAAAGDLGVQWVSVHASAGSAVLRAAVHAARPYPQLRVLALTVITLRRVYRRAMTRGMAMHALPPHARPWLPVPAMWWWGAVSPRRGNPWPLSGRCGPRCPRADRLGGPG